MNCIWCTELYLGRSAEWKNTVASNHVTLLPSILNSCGVHLSLPSGSWSPHPSPCGSDAVSHLVRSPWNKRKWCSAVSGKTWRHRLHLSFGQNICVQQFSVCECHISFDHNSYYRRTCLWLVVFSYLAIQFFNSDTENKQARSSYVKLFRLKDITQLITHTVLNNVAVEP